MFLHPVRDALLVEVSSEDVQVVGAPLFPDGVGQRVQDCLPFRGRSAVVGVCCRVVDMGAHVVNMFVVAHSENGAQPGSVVVE